MAGEAGEAAAGGEIGGGELVAVAGARGPAAVVAAGGWWPSWLALVRDGCRWPRWLKGWQHGGNAGKLTGLLFWVAIGGKVRAQLQVQARCGIKDFGVVA
jgi:hypothetical protein